MKALLCAVSFAFAGLCLAANDNIVDRLADAAKYLKRNLALVAYNVSEFKESVLNSEEFKKFADDNLFMVEFIQSPNGVVKKICGGVHLGNSKIPDLLARDAAEFGTPFLAIFDDSGKVAFKSKLADISAEELVSKLKDATGCKSVKTDSEKPLHNIGNFDVKKYLAKIICLSEAGDIVIPMEIRSVNGFGFSSQEVGMEAKDFAKFIEPKDSALIDAVSKKPDFFGNKFYLRLRPADANSFKAEVYFYNGELEGFIEDKNIVDCVVKKSELRTSIALWPGVPVLLGGIGFVLDASNIDKRGQSVSLVILSLEEISGN